MAIEISLEGKIALVTGASSGIGLGVAKVLSRAGAEVIIVARSPARLKEASEEIKEYSGREPHIIPADLTKREDLERISEKLGSLGMPDVFFYSIGGPKPGRFMDFDMNDWEEAFRLLIYPAIYLTRIVLPYMISKRWGRIIFLTSLAIKEPIPNLALSNVIRISFAGLVRTLAREVGANGITVNGIMPGVIKTRRVEEIARVTSEKERISFEEALSRLTSDIPAGRLGTPEEIGYLAAFLASDYASYINGAMIPVDGGKQVSVF
ncbi:SDR family oxidoreductase [Infirmifilum uzonense]|uniref:SDR family oxidoreductase n=1 Tax=Infirmifilum uzonense TaxID=1550241 RepID=UPI003C72A2E3